eukprot:1121381-Alexandrium_andersonii.AAC.1
MSASLVGSEMCIRDSLMCNAAYSARRSAQASGGSYRSRRGWQPQRLRATSADLTVKQAWSERSRCQLASAS